MMKISTFDSKHFTEENLASYNENLEMCYFCMRAFSEDDRTKEHVRMFQSTNCFHTFHFQCFKDMADHDLCSVNRVKEEFEFKEAHCPTC